MYRSCKIHKPLVNGFPKLRPILSALSTDTHKWAKFFVLLLRHLTSKEFTLRISFKFAKIICEQDPGLFTVSLDVNSLFTNVPLEETINICFNELFKSNSSILWLNKKQITNMLSATTKESIILFDMDFYTQVNDVAMVSPLGPSVANAFLWYHGTKWWNDYPKKFQPVLKGMLMAFLFCSKDLSMLNLLLTIWIVNIKTSIFLLKWKKIDKCPSLMSMCSVRMVHFWPVFTENFYYFSSIIPLEHKFGLGFVSDVSKFRCEIEKLKEILLSNGYSHKFIDKSILKLMNKLYITKSVM